MPQTDQSADRQPQGSIRRHGSRGTMWRPNRCTHEHGRVSGRFRGLRSPKLSGAFDYALPRRGTVVLSSHASSVYGALVAQGIERRTPKPGVAGSNPAGGTYRRPGFAGLQSSSALTALRR